MNLSFISAIMLVISGVLAYISYLRSKIVGHESTIASLKSDAQNKEFKDAIEAASKMVTETTIDYQKARDDFRSKYGTGDGSGSSSQPPTKS